MGVKTERNKQQKRDALLNTAFHLFSTKGMQKTSISDIVEEAGVAKGTFYLYFQDKSDIRNKLISHKASQLFQSAYAAMKATGITSFEEQIIYIVDFILDKLSKDTMLMTFISKHLSWGVFKNALTGAESGEPCTSSLFVKMLEESGHVFKEALCIKQFESVQPQLKSSLYAQLSRCIRSWTFAYGRAPYASCQRLLPASTLAQHPLPRRAWLNRFLRIPVIVVFPLLLPV